MKEKYYINLRSFLLISLILIFISLFIVNGPFWLLLSLVEWILFVYVLWIIYLRHSSKQKTKWNIPEFFKGFIITLIILLPLLISLVSYPIIMIPITYVRAEANRAEVEELVFDITKNCTTNESKVIALLNWFERESGNIKNIWSGKSLGPLKFLGYSPKDWIICVGTLERKPALFVFTSRCGACEEHSVLFREMTNVVGLQVRSVICLGIDHLWDEVLIDEQWIIVDPANVVFSKNKSGYNLSAESFERGHAGKTHNISYVFAEYSNGTIEDITHRYAGNLSCINIYTVDENLNPVSNVEITIFSNNKFTKQNTGLSFHTDEFGLYQLYLGGGNVTLGSMKEGVMPLFNETTQYFIDGESYNLTMILKGDWSKNYYPISMLVLFIIILIMVFVYWIYKRWKKCV
jgi:Transglutaminase-like superfamily